MIASEHGNPTMGREDQRGLIKKDGFFSHLHRQLETDSPRITSRSEDSV